jgi:hypothetical protein
MTLIDDDWILNREPGESDESRRAAVEFWRKLFRLAAERDGVSVIDRLMAGQAVDLSPPF